MVASAGVLSPLMDALYHGRTDEAERLAAEAGPQNLNVHEAAAMGAVERLEQLLDQHPDEVNAWSSDGFQPLALAAFFGRPQAVEMLLARGAEVSTPARHQFHVTPLHAALAGPTPQVARVLIAAGADVNARQQGGVTPLQEAAGNGQIDLVELLLEHGADATATDDNGRTAIDWARERGQQEVVALLEGR
jgi:ankyrin repeat protein